MHGISKPEQEGKNTLENIRILITDLEKNRMLASNKAPHISYDGNLTHEESAWFQNVRWKTTKGWRSAKKQSFLKGWIIKMVYLQ